MSQSPREPVDSSPAKCPHLGSVVDGARGPASSSVGPSGRCFAFRDPVVLSLDQQRLVCFTDRHLACRRFALSSTGSAPTSGMPDRPLLARPAVLAALIVLVLALVVAVGYLLGGGDLAIGGLTGT